MNTTKAIHILLVEDDDLLRGGLERFLTLSGHKVTAIGDSMSFYREIHNRVYDIALIDLGLPDRRGETLIDHLRRNSATAIVVITALDDLDTRVACYHAGADLFLSKPVDGKELLAAIGSLVTRTRLTPQEATFSHPECDHARWTLQSHARSLISPDGQRLGLTAKEWTLFFTLASHPDHTTRQTLLNALYQRDDHSAQQALDTLLRRTRQKIVKKLHLPDPILNDYGIGYRFAGLLTFEGT